MIKFLKSLFGSEKPVTAEVPYKVEAPATTPVVEQASQAVVESIAPAKKKPATKKAPAKAPAKAKAAPKPKAPAKTPAVKKVGTKPRAPKKTA